MIDTGYKHDRSDADTASKAALGPITLAFFRVYGLTYIFTVVLLHQKIIALLSTNFGNLAGFATKIFLAFMIILGFALTYAPIKFYKIAASPFYAIVALMVIFVLFRYVIPATLSLALGIFELLVLFLISGSV